MAAHWLQCMSTVLSYAENLNYTFAVCGTLSLSLSSRQKLSDWLDVFKTSLRLTEHAIPPPPSRRSPPLLSTRSSYSLPPCLSLRAPKPKALKRDFKCGRIEEEEGGVVLARAVVTTTECATTVTATTVERQSINGSAPTGGVNYLTLAS